MFVSKIDDANNKRHWDIEGPNTGERLSVR